MRTFCLLILFLDYLYGYGQSAKPDTTPLVIKHLLYNSKPLPYIHCKSLKGVVPDELLPVPLRNEFQYLVKTSGHLYSGVDGTGFLFEITDSLGLIRFRRIDKTHHYGNSYGATYFTWKDTIYSLGGYGFWRSNGQLRYYNSVTRDWQLIKLNREVHLTNSITWIDTEKGRVYCYGSYATNQAITESSTYEPNKSIEQVYVLDISKGSWETLGRMQSIRNGKKEEINRQIFSEKANHSSSNPLGHFTVILDKFYLDDFRTNKQFEAKTVFYKKHERYYSSVWNIQYYIDSVFYLGNTLSNDFDSIRFSIRDFKPTGKEVYESTTTDFIEYPTFLRDSGFVVAGAALGWILFFVVKRKKNKHITEPMMPIVSSEITVDEFKIASSNNEKNEINNSPYFDEIETNLIGFILLKSKEDQTASVPEINKLLGLSEKNESVKKKNRSEKINSINEKWMVLTNDQRILIKRQRSEFDKRSFEYYIARTDFNKAEQYL